MLKYILLKVRRAVTAYLWVTVAPAVLGRATQFNNWAESAWFVALHELHNERRRIGKLRLEAAVAEKLEVSTTALASVQAAHDAGKLAIARADSRVEDAKQFLNGAVF